MLKQIIIAVLLVTVIGAGVAAFAYNAANQESVVAATSINPLSNGQNFGQPGQAAPGQQIQADSAAQGVAVAQGMEGEPWQAIGNITALDDFGFDFTTTDGEKVYIELGPPDYWQAQGVELNEGELLLVTGSINDGMIHASQVQLADGQVLQVRSDVGQPLWSGGVSNSRGQNGQSSGSADGSHTPDPQAQVDEWVTIEGTLISYQGGSMTISTADGSLLTFQTGQPRFFAAQGVTFQVGDQISVLGFYQGDQFSAGEITQLATSLRVMLRDPNGRPLWAGPGGNGNGGGNGGSQGNGGPQG